MKQTVIINGYETEIEFVDNQPQYPTVDGNENAYTINYSNRLVEYGGIATLELGTYNTDANIQEGSAVVTLPTSLSNWLTTNLTVTDVGGRVNEHAHIVKNSDNQLTIWGGVHGQGNATMRVHWSVKGKI